MFIADVVHAILEESYFQLWGRERALSQCSLTMQPFSTVRVDPLERMSKVRSILYRLATKIRLYLEMTNRGKRSSRYHIQKLVVTMLFDLSTWLGGSCLCWNVFIMFCVFLRVRQIEFALWNTKSLSRILARIDSPDLWLTALESPLDLSRWMDPER